MHLSTAFLIRHYQGGARAKPVYKFDTGLVSLIGQLLAHAGVSCRDQ